MSATVSTPFSQLLSSPMSSPQSPLSGYSISPNSTSRGSIKLNTTPTPQRVVDQVYSSGVVPISTASSRSPTVLSDKNVVESTPLIPSFMATQQIVKQTVSPPKSPKQSSPATLPALPAYIPLSAEISRPLTPPRISPPSSPSKNGKPRSPSKTTPVINIPNMSPADRSRASSDPMPPRSTPVLPTLSSFEASMDNEKQFIDSSMLFNQDLLNKGSFPTPVSQYSPYSKEKELSPVPSQSPRMSSFVETISETSIESQLNKYKYTIVDRVILQRQDGLMNVEYVKCYDPNGITVFVMLDIKGTLGVQMPDLTTVHVAKGSSIPLSDKLAANDCAGSGICGVALECRDELCTIVRQNDGSSKEATFVMTEEYSTKTMTPDGSPVASVIIRMSEILQDYKGTLDRTRVATQRIRENAFKASQEGLDRTMKQSQLLHDAIGKFGSNRNAAYESLKKSIAQLQSYTDKYYTMFADNTITPTSNTSYNLTIGNLYARNKIFADMITLTTAFNSMEKDIKEISDRVISLNNTLCSKHEKVVGEMTMDQIKAVVNL
jgi:hypothetical protein